MPKFSIIITTCNRKELFEKAFKSAVNQNFEDYEIVVVNNGDEPVKDIIEKLKDNRSIKLINYNEKRSPSISANIGIKNSNGEWICFLDDDDEISNDYLTTLNENIKEDDYWVIINGYWRRGDKIKPIINPKLKLNIKNKEKLIEFLVVKLKYYFKWCYVIKKKIYEKLNFFDEDLIRSEDFRFTIKLISNEYFPTNIILKPIYFYSTPTQSEKRHIETIETFKKIFQKYESLFNKNRLFKKIKATILYNIGWHFLYIKKEEEAINFFKQSFKINPSFKTLLRIIMCELKLNKRFDLEKKFNKILGRFWVLTDN